jgi:short subunit fatty acids transporter
MIFANKERVMKLTGCLKRTIKKAAVAAVLVAAIPMALCFIGVWGLCAGGGDIKSC